MLGISMNFIPTSVSIYFPTMKNNGEASSEYAGECSLDPTFIEEKNSFSLFIYTTNVCANQEKYLNKYNILNSDENMDICKPVNSDKDIYGITHTYATGNIYIYLYVLMFYFSYGCFVLFILLLDRSLRHQY
jgi:hypothetical protein